MTASTNTHHQPVRPQPRTGLAWLVSGAARLRERWMHAYRRGQLGPLPGEIRHDRRPEVFDLMLPRFY